MIKLQNLTPEIYYKESRDFQLIGRLFDLALNAVKTDADLIYTLPVSDNSDDKLLELLAMTLGFKAKHQYSTAHLRAICKVFPEALRNKGTIKAIVLACNALFTADGLDQVLDYDFSSENDNTTLNLYIPQEFNDITLLNDLLAYLLPAGMSCNIIKEMRVTKGIKTAFAVNDVLRIYNDGEHRTAEGRAVEYDNNVLAKLPDVKQSEKDRASGIVSVSDVLRGLVQDNIGFIMNGAIYRPEE